MRGATRGGPPPCDEIAGRLRSAGCVFADDEARLLVAAARDGGDLVGMVERRCDGVPLEHVLGWASFCGHRVAVGAGVFVPRVRTQFLASLAARHARPGAVLVELCCGSGAVALAVAALVPGVRVHACDVDPAAVRCAEANLAPYDASVSCGDLFDAVPAALRGAIDVLVANPPYVPTAELPFLPAEARDHEPAVALDGGPDGLRLHRLIAARAAEWMAPGGVVLVETSAEQAPLARGLLADSGFDADVARDARLDATVVVAVERTRLSR